MCDSTNRWLMYVVLGGGYKQEDTLTVGSCYHTHGALIFNEQLMHPPAYMYSPAQHPEFIIQMCTKAIGLLVCTHNNCKIALYEKLAHEKLARDNTGTNLYD